MYSHTCDKNNHSACPDCVHEKVRKLQPGDCLTLVAGTYNSPVTCSGLRGVRGQEITIRGTTPVDSWWEKQLPQRPGDGTRDALFTSGIDDVGFCETANILAKKKQADGGSPGLYYVADEASVYLSDCQHVRVENLYFEHCWPTGLYIDNCQDISVRQCQFRWGTFAIGATGTNTRHLLIEECRWQQNPKNNGGHWKTIPWHRIHGHINDSKDLPDGGIVNVDRDYRMFDGDFFCAWQIAGDVTLRRNLIEDAFNAIHMFNDQETVSTKLNRNVLIEANRFERIRDNAVEPEEAAWNWVVRHNVFVDVYSWFSLEMERSGWFYIYGNLAWHTQSPGPGHFPQDKNQEADPRSGGGVFKLPKHHVADGPTYFFHNSFYLRERIVKKRRFSGLEFFNNAIFACSGEKNGCAGLETLFANNFRDLAVPHNPSDGVEVVQKIEKKRFTKDWAGLNISFHDNVISGPNKTVELVQLGYAMGANSKDSDPGFAGPFGSDSISCDSFKLKEGLRSTTSANNSSCDFQLSVHDIQTITERGKRNMGAYQDDGLLFELLEEFQWIVDV